LIQIFFEREPEKRGKIFNTSNCNDSFAVKKEFYPFGHFSKNGCLHAASLFHQPKE